jgi:hypothetical protein
MCPELGLGCSSAAGDRIGEANFESQAVGEGTVVAGLLWAMAASRVLLDGQGKARGFGHGPGYYRYGMHPSIHS